MDILRHICKTEFIAYDCEWWALEIYSWVFLSAFAVIWINIAALAIFSKRGVRPRFVDKLLGIFK